MDEVKKILQYKEKIERGGKEVRSIAEEIHQQASSEEACKKLAFDLFAHEKPAIKMVAVFLFGILASRTNNALSFLHGKVSQEQDWR
ncbi:MAG TPA: hypothetical protein VGU68_03740, partial [Ktedonobacteraceae bacterium]|nr:hypothetical protein [Ktedonobacteraceae bacterium]